VSAKRVMRYRGKYDEQAEGWQGCLSEPEAVATETVAYASGSDASGSMATHRNESSGPRS